MTHCLYTSTAQPRNGKNSLPSTKWTGKAHLAPEEIFLAPNGLHINFRNGTLRKWLLKNLPWVSVGKRAGQHGTGQMSVLKE